MITKEAFDVKDGKEIHKYTIHGDITVEVLDYGATITAIKVPDKNGKPTDVALGAVNSEIKEYMGAVIGRYANRIGGGTFFLGGKKYQLFKNDGENTLHGGKEGFNAGFFSAKTFGNILMLSYVSEDGEENFPGTLYFTVKYTVKGTSLLIDYYAESHSDTVINFTNHTYFNLNGESDGDISDVTLTINADKFLPVDKNLITTGEEKNVEGTAFDFRKGKKIGASINDGEEQLLLAGGYDHNYCLNGKFAATAYSEKTGIAMDVYTDMPGMQFYSGNFLNGVKGKSVYKKRSGFCLETQFYPDAVNKPQWKSPVLKSGKKYHSRTEYRFYVK